MPATKTIPLAVVLFAVLPLTATALVTPARGYEVDGGRMKSDIYGNRGHFPASLPPTKREITHQQLLDDNDDELTGIIASCIGHDVGSTTAGYLKENCAFDAATQEGEAEKIASEHIGTPDADTAMGDVYTDTAAPPATGHLLGGEEPVSLMRGEQNNLQLQRRSNGWWANMLGGLSNHHHHPSNNDHLHSASSTPSINGGSGGGGGVSAPMFSPPPPPPSSGPVSSADWDSSGSGRGSNGGNGMGWGMGDGACDEDGVEFRPSGPMWRAGGK